MPVSPPLPTAGHACGLGTLWIFAHHLIPSCKESHSYATLRPEVLWAKTLDLLFADLANKIITILPSPSIMSGSVQNVRLADEP